MKNSKKVLSLSLVAALSLTLTGCGKNFKAIEKKDFKDGLKAIKLEDNLSDYKNCELDGEYDLEYKATAYDDNQTYVLYIFEDEEDAREYFEDNYYEDYEDIVDDEDFDGEISGKLGKNSGYILLNGESDSKKLLGKTDVYGGFFYKDNMILRAYATTTKKSDIKDINSFLEAIDYPQPKN